MIQKNYKEILELVEEIERSNGYITEQIVVSYLKKIYPNISEDSDLEENSKLLNDVEESKIFQSFIQNIFQEATKEEILEFSENYLKYGNHSFIKCIQDEDVKLDLIRKMDRDALRFYLVLSLEEKDRIAFISEYEGRDKIRIIESLEKEKRIPYIMKMEKAEDRVELYSDLGVEWIKQYLIGMPEIYDPAFVLNREQLKQVFSEIEDDLYKTKILMSLYLHPNEAIDFMPYVQDEYYKKKIAEHEYSERCRRHISKNTVLKELEEYAKHKEYLENMQTELDKTRYIIELKDNEMKLSFLKYIEERNNREYIIQSLTHYIDPEIQRMATLMQNMIWEWTKNVYVPEEIPDAIREVIQITFNRTDVRYEHLEHNVNGEADHINQMVKISQRRRFQPNKVIGYLAHEYAHTFSYRDFKLYPINQDSTIEEGNADIFSDLVINHYLQKHSEIKDEFAIDDPYITNSSYDFENGWTRSLLYPLEQEKLAEKALLEYLVGDKRQYLEMVLGKEYADNLQKAPNGIFEEIPITYKRLYESHTKAFQEINQNSVYYKRNFILPAFIIQDKVGDRSDIKIYELGDRCFNAEYMANDYFAGRGFSEIEPEEMQEFITLIQHSKCSRHSFFVPIEEFVQKQYNKLEHKEKEEKCSKLLENTIILFNNGVDMSSEDIETTILEVIDYQIKKVEQGKGKEQTRKLKEMMQNTPMNFSGVVDQDKRENLEDAFSYLNTKLDMMEQGQCTSQDVMQMIKVMSENLEVGITREEMQMGISTIKQELQNEQMMQEGEKNGR